MAPVAVEHLGAGDLVDIHKFQFQDVTLAPPQLSLAHSASTDCLPDFGNATSFNDPLRPQFPRSNSDRPVSQQANRYVPRFSRDGGPEPSEQAVRDSTVEPKVLSEPFLSGATRPGEYALSKGRVEPDKTRERRAANALLKPAPSPSFSSSLANLARKPWSKSRSSSPTRLGQTNGASVSTPELPKMGSTKPPASMTYPTTSTSKSKNDMGTRPSLQSRKSFTRGVSSLGSLRRKPNPPVESKAVPLLPNTLSTAVTRDFAQPASSYSSSRQSVSSRESSTGKLTYRDPLLSSGDPLRVELRRLENECASFHTKTVTMKAKIVRGTLLPFLRATAQHESNGRLPAEELEKRTYVLDQWWKVVLELLSGSQGQTLSWTDRHVLSEAITAIMIRAEWRNGPSEFAPISERYPGALLRADSAASFESIGSDFLSESVHHNIRNAFAANLMSQMAFVVSAMSLRSAPPSLVALSGKTAAYAFFFCPGVAHVLIDLWKTSPRAIQRILDECGINQSANFEGKYEDIVHGFPRHLQNLRFTSYKDVIQSIWRRKKYPLPVSANSVEWRGKWLPKWIGKETDLLFVFVKHFHRLFAEFLPPGTTLRDHICAPAYLQIHAHLLTIFDSSLNHRTNRKKDGSRGPSSITFDDMLETAAATAPMLSPMMEFPQTMEENRLIFLLRDVLFARVPLRTDGQQVFASTFSILTQAAAAKVEVFDQAACASLCEFLELAMPILSKHRKEVRYSKSLIDWSFWQVVCRRMVESENTLTEIRMLSFVYSMWDTITIDPMHKELFSLGWLLREEVFQRHFCHWSPMVRAYFMRLVCWRLARYDGTASELDVKILYAISSRLKLIWAQHCYLAEEAEELDCIPPSTTPSCPAPNRRFLITKELVTAAPANLPFEGLMGISAGAMGVSKGNVTPPSSTPSSKDNGVTSTKTWKVLRSIIGVASVNGGAPPSPPESPTVSNTPRLTKDKAQRPPPALEFSFRFSLEWYEPPPDRLPDPRLPVPQLPTPAESFLRERTRNVYLLTPQIDPAALGQSMKYSGRALAEWHAIVSECNTFYEKRYRDGVTSDTAVETPSLGVEAFRRGGFS